MNAAEHIRMAELERDHWWFRGTRAVILAELDRALAWAPGEEGRGGAPLARRPRLLDLGCGTGGTTAQLGTRGEVIGLDSVRLALDYARGQAPGATLLQGGLAALPLADGSIDLACALDVVEHLADDVGALAEIARVLRPGGRLLLTVPAWPALWSEHDVALGHHRRYEAQELRTRLQGAGLRVERLSYYNSLLLAPAAAWRLGRNQLQRWRRWACGEAAPRDQPAHSDLRPLPGPLNRVLAALIASERHLLRFTDLPLGLSLIAVARRPSERGEA